MHRIIKKYYSQISNSSAAGKGTVCVYTWTDGHGGFTGKKSKLQKMNTIVLLFSHFKWG